ncbi:MAG: hypothetical protein RLY86_122 [Pseudomonadota bacterium]
MWARLTDDGTLVELTTLDPAGRFHPALSWVAVPAPWRPWVRPGWVSAGDGVAPADVPAFKAQLKAALADRRWRVETGGLTLPDGTVVRTDRESQALITGAALQAQLSPDQTVEFKAATGWVTLTAAQVLAVGVAVGQHVRAAFARERAISAAIDAAPTPAAALAAYTDNINTGWPGHEGAGA